MRSGFERVQPARRSWYVLGQFRKAVDSLMRGVDGLVCSRFDLIAVRNIFEVWVVLIAGGSSEEQNAEQDEASERSDYLQATWKKGTRIPVFGHVGEGWHNGRLRGRGAHTSCRLV